MTVDRLSRLKSSSEEDYFVSLQLGDKDSAQKLQTQARPLRQGRRRIVWNQMFDL